MPTSQPDPQMIEASNVAAFFINSLPNVGRGVLSEEDQTCSLCHEKYGTQPSPRGIIERPIKLPCSHILGSECITQWLTGHGNSCPICRHIFFPHQGTLDDSEISDSEDSIEDDDGGETYYQILDAAEFDINDKEQYTQRRSCTPSLHAPPDFTREVANHAWRLRCERTLYIRLQSRSPTLPALPGDESSTRELDAHHINLLFQDLEARGIFHELWGAISSDRMQGLPTRRQMWDLMRDMGFGYGPSYGSIQDEDWGRWSRTVWYPRDPSRGGRPWWMIDVEYGG